MGRQLSNLEFDAWLNFAFDHPVTEPAWYWSDESDCWDGSPAETVQLLTQTFLQSDALRRFSDGQLNQGFWFLVDNSCSDIPFCLVDEGVAWPSRKVCLEAIGDLFENCFEKRCSNHLSHLDEPVANPLNAICYMWWDVLPIYGCPEAAARHDLDETILQVLERILGLRSDACRESALHGLGEWHGYYPKEVERIIDHFIWHNRKIRDSLRNYAYAARHGDVL